MAYLRDREGNPMRDASGDIKVIITEAQARARASYERRKENQAEARQLRLEARTARSSKQQLEVLDKKLGKGVGARRERARLMKQIAEVKTAT